MGWWIFRGVVAGGWFAWQWYTGGALVYNESTSPPAYTLGDAGECTLSNGMCE